MSSADITMGNNKIKTTNFNFFDSNGSGMFISASGTNAFAQLVIIPSGTSTLSRLAIYRTSDITNYERLNIGSDVNATEHAILSEKSGTGTLRPINLYMATTKLMSFDTANTITNYVETIMTGSSSDRTLMIAPNSSANTGGIKIYPNNASSGSLAVLEIIGSRSDGNTSGSFGSTIGLAHLRTDQQITGSGTILGRIVFGGNNTDGTFANILHGASIQGEASGTFSSSSNMPIDLVFYTGIVGINPYTSLSQVGTEYMRLTSAGLLSLVGTVSKYNNINTTGLGVSAIYGSFKGSSSAATQTNVINYTPPASSGVYRVRGSIATTAGTNTGTITMTITFKDAAGISKTILPPFKQSGSATSLTSCTGSSLNFDTSWDFYIDNSATAITVTFTVTGTVAYFASATLEQLA
ncbi:MAG: hypothetical protein ACRDFB_10325, partial [Rhabdochlamydiaceae bacterium]